MNSPESSIRLKAAKRSSSCRRAARRPRERCCESMENITIESKSLSQEWLQRFPVWTWDESGDREDLMTPVDAADGILPDDLSQLFVRARFLTSGGRKFGGYVCWSLEVYAVGLY